MMRSSSSISLNRKSNMILRCYYASIAALGTAAVSSSSSITPSYHTAAAFVSTPPTSRSIATLNPTVIPFSSNTLSPFVPSVHTNTYQQNRPLFSSSNNNDDDENLFQKATKKVKSLLNIKTPQEKAAAIEKAKRKQQITGGLTEILKDAPLPVRLMGKMITPLLSNMAESFAEQSKQLQDLLMDAEDVLRNSEQVESLLGSGELQVGMPFSQSSSTSVVNGVKTSNVQASFPVSGSISGVQGICTMQGSMEYGISYLGLNVNGRTYSIALDGQGGGNGSGRTEVFGGASSSYSSGRTKGSGGKFKEEDVIDVEFYDKK